ncbi:hypothetical protein F5884DRAFT_822495 [Xylogone sp. PMI_703]|nr:hypothetical protein F5884DRAFT_822495 [Xylogone sp. PMI_703]
MSKIDVHHHFYPPFFAEVLERAGGDPSGWTIPKWTLEADKRMSREIGSAATILSLTAPGVSIEKDPTAQAQLARQVNAFAAKIRDSEPSSYGFFATLPDLLHTNTALEELKYALDVLGADGVTLFTRYGEDNHYLGHPDINPIWEELNRREAVVFIHPTHAVDTNLINVHLPQPMFDYPHETGRTAIDLITSGTLRRVASKCKIILSHAGGTIPYLIDRVAGMLPYTPFSDGRSTEEIREEARSFYFDTALSSSKQTLDLLYSFAKPGHILFGSDYPNAPLDGIRLYSCWFDAYQVHGSGLSHSKVTREATLAIFPRLRS